MSLLTLVAVVVCTMLSLDAAPARADDSEAPILLSNEDVARLHADAAKARAAEPAQPSADDADEADAAGAEGALDPAEAAALREKLGRVSRRSMGSVTRTIDERLRDGEGETLPVAPGSPSRDLEPGFPASPAPEVDISPPSKREPRASLRRVEPACVYDTRGRLIHEPAGRACAPIRVGGPSKHFEPAQEARARSREPQVGCVYGSRGQLLYSSPGVECAG